MVCLVGRPFRPGNRCHVRQSRHMSPTCIYFRTREGFVLGRVPERPAPDGSRRILVAVIAGHEEIALCAAHREFHVGLPLP